MVADSSPARTSGSTPEANDGQTESGGAEPGRDDRTGARGRSTANAGSDAASESGYACPLCGFTHETRETVYTHLVAGHRKRAISGALLETYSDARTREERSTRR